MKAKQVFGWSYSLMLLLFLYTPIVVLMVMSFNTSQYNALPIVFTTKWYQALVHNEKIITATLNSLWIGLIAALICVGLSTAFALGLKLVGKQKRAFYNSLIMLPLTMPWLIMGLSLLLLLRMLGLDRNFLILVILARVQDMGDEVEEASRSLGANDWTTFYRITLPMLLPAMLSGGFLSFMISFDNFVISYFLIPTGSTTLPIEIYTSIKFGFTPEMNAVATIILLASIISVTLVALFMRSSLKALFTTDKEQ
jgi:spermidine/putrescine transport system permease protein